MQHGSRERAKAVFYQALQHCPWAKVWPFFIPNSLLTCLLFAGMQLETFLNIIQLNHSKSLPCSHFINFIFHFQCTSSLSCITRRTTAKTEKIIGNSKLTEAGPLRWRFSSLSMTLEQSILFFCITIVVIVVAIVTCLFLALERKTVRSTNKNRKYSGDCLEGLSRPFCLFYVKRFHKPLRF